MSAGKDSNAVQAITCPAPNAHTEKVIGAVNASGEALVYPLGMIAKDVVVIAIGSMKNVIAIPTVLKFIGEKTIITVFNMMHFIAAKVFIGVSKVIAACESIGMLCGFGFELF